MNLTKHNLDNLATNIASMRAKLGFSQAELGNRSGIGTATIQRIEKKRVTPHANSLEKIAETLKTTVPELLQIEADEYATYFTGPKEKLGVNIDKRDALIGGYLVGLRYAKNWTQTQLWLASGVSIPTISSYERGFFPEKGTTMTKLTQALGTSFTVLVRRAQAELMRQAEEKEVPTKATFSLTEVSLEELLNELKRRGFPTVMNISVGN